MTCSVNGKLVYCRFCYEEYNLESDTVDRNTDGFWCDHCEGFTYYSATNEESRKFTLILEDKAAENNMSFPPGQPKLNKRVSLLRYPGGKSKITDYLLSHINPDKTDCLSSPYTGGGSLELALLYAGVVKQLTLNDKDFGVYSLFQIIKTFPDALILELKSRRPTKDDFKKAQRLIKSDYSNADMFEAAWSLLLVNRLAFSGIYKANAMGGLKGDQRALLSRWNPDDLCHRISIIHSMSERYTVHNMDALEFIEDQYWNSRSTLFIDPPYFQQGKNLYLHFYDTEEHLQLQFLLDTLYKEFPCADLLVTYDAAPFIEEIYEFPDIKRIKRKFSA